MIQGKRDGSVKREWRRELPANKKARLVSIATITLQMILPVFTSNVFTRQAARDRAERFRRTSLDAEICPMHSGSGCSI